MSECIRHSEGEAGHFIQSIHYGAVILLTLFSLKIPPDACYDRYIKRYTTFWLTRFVELTPLKLETRFGGQVTWNLLGISTGRGLGS